MLSHDVNINNNTKDPNTQAFDIGKNALTNNSEYQTFGKEARIPQKSQRQR